MSEPVCGCPRHPGTGDVRCHVCGEYVNKRCWHCRTPRGEGECPNPLVEFGNVVVVTRGPLDDWNHRRIWLNYLRTKARRFPTWHGQPDIVTHYETLFYTARGWYAAVPARYVTDTNLEVPVTRHIPTETANDIASTLLVLAAQTTDPEDAATYRRWVDALSSDDHDTPAPAPQRHRIRIAAVDHNDNTAVLTIGVTPGDEVSIPPVIVAASRTVTVELDPQT